jgi:hypothetical protein
LRPNYPFSVIPGGAYSPAELRFASEKDGVIRRHYSDFDLKTAHTVLLTGDRYQYVSYRLRNQVYWTRNKLKIPKGEILVTDGFHFARTRCGNRLSDKSKPEISSLQPSERLLSLPAFRPELLSEGEIKLGPVPPASERLPTLPLDLALVTPPLPALPNQSAQVWSPVGAYFPFVPFTTGYISSPIQPGITIPTPPSGPVAVPPFPVTGEVPEPASLYLFGVALCLSLLFLAKMIRSPAP